MKGGVNFSLYRNTYFQIERLEVEGETEGEEKWRGGEIVEVKVKWEIESGGRKMGGGGGETVDVKGVNGRVTEEKWGLRDCGSQRGERE